MSSRLFTEQELKEYVYSAVQETQDDYLGRWSVGVSTVFQAEDDNKFYRFYWSRGLTEMQEDEIYDTECEEVFPHKSVEAVSSLKYLTEAEIKKEKFSIDKKSVLASELISEAASDGIEALKAFDTGPVKEFLNRASSALVAKESKAFLESAQVFFDEIHRLQKKL